MPNKSCPFFRLSILVIYSDILSKYELHRDHCLSKMRNFQVFEMIFSFFKFFSTFAKLKTTCSSEREMNRIFR